MKNIICSNKYYVKYMYILHLICINSKLNLTKAFYSVMMLHRNFVNTLYLVASEGYFYWYRKDIKYGKYEF